MFGALDSVMDLSNVASFFAFFFVCPVFFRFPFRYKMFLFFVVVVVHELRLLLLLRYTPLVIDFFSFLVTEARFR